jgi:hypothetical protein
MISASVRKIEPRRTRRKAEKNAGEMPAGDWTSGAGAGTISSLLLSVFSVFSVVQAVVLLRCSYL